MQTNTLQLESWTSDFGRAYTDRNPSTPEAMDVLWQKSVGVRKSDVFRQFLSPERLISGRVLEVGCNVGIQLQLLGSVNPGLSLHGLEPQSYALRKARESNHEACFIPGTAFDIPFKDGYFDIVMTNNMLIHVHPDDLPRALAEIHRCSRRFIFLYEYFSEEPRTIIYRNEANLLWKMNYRDRYLSQFSDLRCAEERRLHYADPDGPVELIDQVCLLEKAQYPQGTEKP